MKKLLLASALLASFASGLALADEKPVNDLSFNASAVTDYSYRGISQSRDKAAIQGGADYTNTPSGFYVGTWLSSIKWTKDAGGDGNVEWDLYGGKRGSITPDVGYDFGLLNYVYPSNGLHRNANTTEVYGQLSHGPAYIKYSHSLTDTFGFADSKNSGYLDVGANIDVAQGLQLNLHAGHQRIANNSNFSYSDWKVGLTKDFGFVSASLAAVGTNTDNYVGPPGDAKNLGKSRVVAGISKTF